MLEAKGPDPAPEGAGTGAASAWEADLKRAPKKTRSSNCWEKTHGLLRNETELDRFFEADHPHVMAPP